MHTGIPQLLLKVSMSTVYSLKKQKPRTKVEHLVLKPPYKLVGILWAHTDAIGCIALVAHVRFGLSSTLHVATAM